MFVGKDSTTDHEYVCSLCGKEYTSCHGFKNHMLFRHNEGQYSHSIKMCIVLQR